MPVESPEARPVEVTVAAVGLEDVQLTTLVMLEVTPPVNVPMATNCCCEPLLMDVLGGLTDIADNPAKVPVPESDTL